MPLLSVRFCSFSCVITTIIIKNNKRICFCRSGKKHADVIFLERACLSPAPDAVFQCLCVGGGTSMCAWADVSRDACQVYVAVHSLSLAMQVCYTEWKYCTTHRPYSCGDDSRSYLIFPFIFSFNMNESFPKVSFRCIHLCLFIYFCASFFRRHRKITLISRKERSFVPDLAANGCFFMCPCCIVCNLTQMSLSFF